VAGIGQVTVAKMDSARISMAALRWRAMADPMDALTRRTLLPGLLLAPVPACGAPQARPGRSRTAAVIGAGIAGLSAAATLAAAGIEVSVLEGTDRIGGRILTDRSLGAPVDLGAAWIHGPDGNPLSQLARRVDAETLVTDDESLLLVGPDGTAVCDERISWMDGQHRRLLETAVRLGQSSRGLSLAAAVASASSTALEDPLLAWAFNAYTAFDSGAPLDLLSAGRLGEGDVYGGTDVVLPGGYDRLLEPLRAGISIRTGLVVDEIGFTSTGVVLTVSGGGQQSYDVCVCTVPLGVLASSRLKLPGAVAAGLAPALAAHAMGHVCKVSLRFARHHWPQDVRWFGRTGSSDWPLAISHTAMTDRPVITVLTFAETAAAADALPARDREQAGLSALRAMIGSGLPAAEASVSSAWGSLPLSLGAYSYPLAGSPASARQGFSGVFDERLVFAGEHTSTDHPSTAHGALESGQRAAQALLQAIASTATRPPRGLARVQSATR
jgi:monoamine oxidase